MRLGIVMPGHLAAIVAGDAARYGHEVVFRRTGRSELLAELEPDGTRPVDAVVVAASGEVLDGQVLEAADRRGVRLVAIAVDRRDRAAERLGLVALPAGVDWEEIESALRGAVPAAPAARGRVVAVWGADGAPGRSTVAIALAAAMTEHPTVLVDADTRAASIAIALGLLDEAPGIAAACRLAAVGALEPAELERVAVPLPGGHPEARVLTGIARADRWPELSAERLRGALDACRAWRAVTVVDVAAPIERDEEVVAETVGPRRAAATIAALEAADAVVLVGSADPVGAARMIDAAAALADLTGAAVVPVVNRMRAGAIGGIDPRRQLVGTLERFGGIRDPVLVPLDQAAADRALRTAAPLPIAAPRSAATAALRRLARTVLERIGAEAPATVWPSRRG